MPASSLRQASVLQRGRDGGELLVEIVNESLPAPGVEVGAGGVEPLVAHG
jgi:hypothetical protein